MKPYTSTEFEALLPHLTRDSDLAFPEHNILEGEAEGEAYALPNAAEWLDFFHACALEEMQEAGCWAETSATYGMRLLNYKAMLEQYRRLESFRRLI